jgi:hypothetical protein
VRVDPFSDPGVNVKLIVVPLVAASVMLEGALGTPTVVTPEDTVTPVLPATPFTV